MIHVQIGALSPFEEEVFSLSHLGVEQHRDISYKGFDLGAHLGKLVKHAVFIQGLKLQ